MTAKSDSVSEKQKPTQLIDDHTLFGVKTCKMMGLWFTFVPPLSLHGKGATVIIDVRSGASDNTLGSGGSLSPGGSRWLW